MVAALNWSIETFGWRFSYIAFGVFILVGGLIAVLLIPPHRGEDVSGSSSGSVRELDPARGDFGIILRSPQFWIICGAFFLCMLGTPLHSSQMNMMLVENGLTTQTAANVVSIYAASTILGRLACGIALDRYPTPYVTAASMFLPAIGLFLLATSLNTVPVITFAMFLVGIYVGAESDILAYLVARYFKLRIYNSTLSLKVYLLLVPRFGGRGRRDQRFAQADGQFLTVHVRRIGDPVYSSAACCSCCCRSSRTLKRSASPTRRPSVTLAFRQFRNHVAAITLCTLAPFGIARAFQRHTGTHYPELRE